MSAADDPRWAQDHVRDQLVAAARREPDPSRTAQTALRDALVAAAVREHAGAAAVRRRGRRRRRTAGILVVALLGAAAAAEGTGLISVGEPIQPHPGLEAGDPKVTIAGGEELDVVAQAADRERGVSYGAALYTSAAGHRCVIAGQLRGNQLGLERDGTFHRFSDLRPGICLENGSGTNDLMRVDSTPPRTLMYGLLADPRKAGVVTLRATGERRAVEPVRGGAWLLVFDGAFTPADLDYDKP